MKALKILARVAIIAVMAVITAPNAATAAPSSEVSHLAVCCRNITLFNLQDVKILTVEADLTPTHTLAFPDGSVNVVNGWGWTYNLKTSWPSTDEVWIGPLGVTVTNGRAKFREWSAWGIPGNIVEVPVRLLAPPPDTYDFRVYSVVGDKVVRAFVNIWKAEDGTTRFETGQIAVGELVPADPNFYKETPLPDLTKGADVVTDYPNGATIGSIHLKKVSVATNSDGWTVVAWKADRVTLTATSGKTDTFYGGLNLLELNPNVEDAWYQKRVADVWNPARLIGIHVCPYAELIQAVQTVYTWTWSNSCG